MRTFIFALFLYVSAFDDSLGSDTKITAVLLGRTITHQMRSHMYIMCSGTKNIIWHRLIRAQYKRSVK